MSVKCNRDCCAYHRPSIDECSEDSCHYASQAQPPYFAWLVENEEDGKITYLSRTDRLEFIVDANMALHFSRECDAKSFALIFANTEAVQHGF